MIFVKESKRKTRPSTGESYKMVVGAEIPHIASENCICNKCIDDYLLLYERIEQLEDIRMDIRSKFSREKKDKINTILSRRIKDKSKE